MNTIQQISVFLENKQGSLSAVANILKENNIDIISLNLADTSDFGILRLIVDDHEKACQVLRDADWLIRVNDLIGVRVNDEPGGMATILQILDDKQINVEYLYDFICQKNNHTYIIFRMEQTDAGLQALLSANVELLSADDLCNP